MTTYTTQPRPTRSIVGPLILIAFGTLWLLMSQGVIETANFWAVARFWPVLLIILGVDALLRWRWPLAANVVAFITVGLTVAAIIFAPRLGLTGTSSWMFGMPFMMGGRPASGHVITETRDVSGFDAVSFSILGDVVIQPGDREGLTIEGEDDLLAEIRTQVRGGTLYIEARRPGQWPPMQPTKPLRFTITVVNLEQLELSGAGNVRVEDLSTERLEATLSGAGGLDLAGLETNELTTNLTGAGNVKATGTASHLEVVVSGVGSFNGSDLQTETARVRVTGTGGATVWATGELEATISGVGSVAYYGSPTVQEDVSGLGNLRRLGEK